MSVKASFRQSLYPWVDISPGDDTNAVLASFLRCHQALDSLLEFRISWDDYLEILASEGVDLDEYLQIAEDNVSLLIL